MLTRRGLPSVTATAEKALFDTLHLAPARSRLFARLPELETPPEFRWQQLRALAALVKFVRRRVHIERRIEQLEQEWVPRAAAASERPKRSQRRR
jgi:hypothetical protein